MAVPSWFSTVHNDARCRHTANKCNLVASLTITSAARDRQPYAQAGEIDADPSASLERRYTVNEFGSNVERHRRELLVHCYRMLGSLPDAEDAVQETLLRAWRYRDNVKEGAPLRPWLYRVATNACLESMSVVWFPASSETFQ
jgi:hypothetical protein